MISSWKNLLSGYLCRLTFHERSKLMGTQNDLFNGYSFY